MTKEATSIYPVVYLVYILFKQNVWYNWGGGSVVTESWKGRICGARKVDNDCYRTYKYKNTFLLTEVGIETVDVKNNGYDYFMLLYPLSFYVLKVQRFEHTFYFRLHVINGTHSEKRDFNMKDDGLNANEK